MSVARWHQTSLFLYGNRTAGRAYKVILKSLCKILSLRGLVLVFSPLYSLMSRATLLFRKMQGWNERASIPIRSFRLICIKIVSPQSQKSKDWRRTLALCRIPINREVRRMRLLCSPTIREISSTLKPIYAFCGTSLRSG